MEIRVLKFGGTSLSNGTQFKKVADIIKENNSRKYIIASAPGKCNNRDEKVTDLLNICYELSRNQENIDKTFKIIENKYEQIIEELELDFPIKLELGKIKRSILENAGRDYISSRGEYLSGKILARYLKCDFIDAENKIFFTEEGRFDSEKTNIELSKALIKYPKAVIPGFYGSMPNGKIKTFPRGGSDITGAIVARAVNASVYENWTDVSGMYIVDPSIIGNSKVIDLITYKELRELSYMGASVLHEDSIFPVKELGIPINIRNVNSPKDSGTTIVPSVEFNKNDNPITGITGKKGFSIITIEKDMMNKEVGFGRKILGILEDNNVAFEHLPTGVDTMSIIVHSNSILNIEENIKDKIYKELNPNYIKIENNLAIIAIIGRNMRRQKGTAIRALSAIEDASIDIRMIDFGASELNMIIGVGEDDYLLALEKIYMEFVK